MALIHFVFGLIALGLVVATLPGTVELLMLTLAAFRGKRALVAAPGMDAVKLGIVIPAHNERNGIPDTIQSLMACDHPLSPLDLHVIADNCSDDTAAVARGLGCDVMERVDDSLRGKGYALDFAFSRLLEQDYDALIVVDADTRVETNFLDEYRRLFAAGGSAGQCAYKVANASVNRRTRLMNIAFLAFNYLRPLGRDRLGLSAGILGNGFAVSTHALRKVPYNSFSIVEDLEYHPRLIREGCRVQFLANTTVWSDMPETAEDAKSQRERWEGGRFRMILDLGPRLLKDVFAGKLRLLEPLLELLLLPLSYHVLLVTALLVVAPAGWISSYAWVALLTILFHVCAAMWLGKASAEDWKTLATAPFYMAWKLANFGGILKAATRNAGWTRTARKED